jgi:predicted NodU family carbamoyl transferase
MMTESVPKTTIPRMPQASSEDVIAVSAYENWQDSEWRGALNACYDGVGYDITLVRKHKAVEDENFLQKALGKNPDLYISHHLAHTLSAWAFRPDDKERLFLSYDGVGLNAINKLDCFLAGYIGESGFRLIDNPVPIPSSMPLGGLLGYNSAGKAMGLAGHMPKQNLSMDQVPRLMQAYLNNNWQPCYPHFHKPTDAEYQIVANFYRFVTGHIWQGVKENIEKFGNGNGVVISGGSTLALEINSKISDLAGSVVFAPPTDDSGQALGAAIFAYYHTTKKWPKIHTPSLNSLQDPLPAAGPQDLDDIAALIASNAVVGLVRGKSEAGPRALGFRSMLAVPHADNLKRVSQKIKKREFYRPLAPIVTARQFSELFEGPMGEYMQYRCFCKPLAKKLTPAVVHTDNSVRPQVVYPERDPWMHDLLVKVGKLTGVECLINTSLNAKNKPICNTYEDARRELRGTEVEIVSLPHEAWEMPITKNKLMFV